MSFESVSLPLALLIIMIPRSGYPSLARKVFTVIIAMAVVVVVVAAAIVGEACEAEATTVTGKGNQAGVKGSARRLERAQINSESLASFSPSNSPLEEDDEETRVDSAPGTGTSQEETENNEIGSSLYGNENPPADSMAAAVEEQTAVLSSVATSAQDFSLRRHWTAGADTYSFHDNSSYPMHFDPVPHLRAAEDVDFGLPHISPMRKSKGVLRKHLRRAKKNYYLQKPEKIVGFKAADREYKELADLHKRQQKQFVTTRERLDAFQRASLEIPFVPRPVALYEEMLDAILDSRQIIPVDPTRPSTPPPSVADAVPDSSKKEKLKKKEKRRKNRFSYTFGESVYLQHYYDADGDCYWRVKPPDSVNVCVPLEELTRYRKTDPTLRVAKDFSQMYATKEEASFGFHADCDELYLDKNSDTYYCIPEGTHTPMDYLYEHYYKDRLNKYRFYQYAKEAVKQMPLPARYAPGMKELEEWAAAAVN